MGLTNLCPEELHHPSGPEASQPMTTRYYHRPGSEDLQCDLGVLPVLKLISVIIVRALEMGVFGGEEGDFDLVGIVNSSHY